MIYVYFSPSICPPPHSPPSLPDRPSAGGVPPYKPGPAQGFFSSQCCLLGVSKYRKRRWKGGPTFFSCKGDLIKRPVCIYLLPFYSRIKLHPTYISLTKRRLKPSSISILPSHPYQKHQSTSGYFFLRSLYLRQNDDAEREFNDIGMRQVGQSKCSSCLAGLVLMVL